MSLLLRSNADIQKDQDLVCNEFSDNGTLNPGRIIYMILVWTEVKKAGRRCRDALFAFFRTKMSFASFKTQKGHSPIGERPASL